MLVPYRFIKVQFSVKIGLYNNLGLNFNPNPKPLSKKIKNIHKQSEKEINDNLKGAFDFHLLIVRILIKGAT